METIIAAIASALITGVLALIGVVISNNNSNRKMLTASEMAQAVTNTKIEELTREVREHNNFARRVPIIEDQMKRTEVRLRDLEKYHKEKP
jgi:hypothetical protein